jgi:hypothetical protein
VGIGADVEGVGSAFELIAAIGVRVLIVVVKGSEGVWVDGDLDGLFGASGEKGGLFIANKDFLGFFDATWGVWGFSIDLDDVFARNGTGVLDFDFDFEGALGKGSGFESGFVLKLMLEGGVA